MAEPAPGVAAHRLDAHRRAIVTIAVMMAVLLKELDKTVANVALRN